MAYWTSNRVFALLQYERVMYFTEGTRFLRNCDDLFLLQPGAPLIARSTVGSGPLSGNVFIARPSWQVHIDMDDVIFESPKYFTSQSGWFGHGYIQPWIRTSTLGGTTRVSRMVDWQFPRAACDQGLMYWYFYLRASTGAVLLPHDAWSDRMK